MDDQTQTPLTSAAFLRVLRRRALVVFACVVLVAAAAVAFSVLREKQYSATATLLFRDPALDERVLGGGQQASEDPFRAAATNLQLVSLDAVAEQTADDLGDLSEDDVDSKVDISERGQSDLVSVTATDPDPERAALIANTFANSFIDLRRRANRKQILETEAALTRRLEELERTEEVEPAEEELRSRLDEVSVLASLQTGNVELAQRAEVPDDPSSAGAVWSGALGALVGLVLGVGLALLFDRLDRRVRNPEDLEEAFGRPILGQVPEGAFPRKGKAKDRLLTGAAEVFRPMGANLRYFAVGGDVKTLAVTSANRADGRTTVAWNLAAAVATAGRRALLIEADLRHPSLAARLGLEQTAGLSDVLAGQAQWEKSVLRIPIGESSQSDATGHSFDLLPAGHPPPNPADLLAAESLTALLRWVQDPYDLVLVDTPATSVADDAVPLLARVDGVLVVVRLGHSKRDEVERLRHHLANLDARILGLVLNSAAPRKGSRRDRKPAAGEPAPETAVTH